MADMPKLRSGQKLKLALETAVGQEPKFDLLCTFFRQLDTSAFLVSVPMQNGAALPLDESRKLLFQIDTAGQTLILAGYADALVQEGIRRYWKIRRVEQRQMFQRADERLKVALHMQYRQDSWRPNRDGIIEKEESLSLDISNGGVAMYLRSPMEVGEICRLSLPRLGAAADGKPIVDLVSVVCWSREAPKGSPFRHICGLQFRFTGSEEKENLLRYVAVVKRKYAL